MGDPYKHSWEHCRNTMFPKCRFSGVSSGICRCRAVERKEPLSRQDTSQGLEAAPGIEPGYTALQSLVVVVFPQVIGYEFLDFGRCGNTVGASERYLAVRRGVDRCGGRWVSLPRVRRRDRSARVT